MKLSVSKDKLKEAIAIALKALSKTVIQVERGHLLFKVSTTSMSVSGTNNDLKARCIIPVTECDQECSFTSDPKMLDKLLTKIDSDTIKMDFDPGNLTLKVYTSVDEQSFNSLQSFPPDKMLTVNSASKTLNNSYMINRGVLLSSLKFCAKYLEAANEENKKFDFIIINNSVAFAANGLNKMGYFVSPDFKGINNIKIRKQAVPLFISVLEKMSEEIIVFGESDNDVVIRTKDINMYFSCLKSTVEAPKIDLNYLKKDGAYVEINRIELTKKLTRLGSTKASMVGSGIELTLSGAGDTSFIDIALLSNLKAKERMNCKRINDSSIDDIKHILDYKLFLTEISSFVGENLNLYINAPTAYFKVIEAIKEEKSNIKYMTVGIGAYSKIRSKVI
jgi:DNA polymerase III sliding clamp (beta) subunit (PCNA family)